MPDSAGFQARESRLWRSTERSHLVSEGHLRARPRIDASGRKSHSLRVVGVQQILDSEIDTDSHSRRPNRGGLDSLSPVEGDRPESGGIGRGLQTADEERANSDLQTRDRIRGKVQLALPTGAIAGIDRAVRIDWAQRSIDYAFSLGVECCVVIPVRPGNGIVEALEAKSLYSRTNLAELQSVVEYGIRSGRGRVFADLWDVENIAGCPGCSAARAVALEEMNLTQRPSASADCSCIRVIE